VTAEERARLVKKLREMNRASVREITLGEALPPKREK